MTEEEARAWVRDRFGVSRETQCAQFIKLLSEESERQNLVSRATLSEAWTRHIVDSAQLLTVTDVPDGLWVDIGSGAGLPGIVIAILREQAILLVEPRRRRVEFLEATARELNLSQVRVALSRVEAVPATPKAAVISARAVAALPSLLANAQHLSDEKTLWLLPKGRTAQSEVDAARASWQGVFHVKPSLTEPGSGIVVARGVAIR